MFDKIKKQFNSAQKTNSKQQSVYKDLANDLMILMRNKVYINFQLRFYIEQDWKVYLCLNDILEYIFYDEKQAQRLQEYELSYEEKKSQLIKEQDRKELYQQKKNFLQVLTNKHESRIKNYCERIKKCSEFNVLMRKEEKQYIMNSTSDLEQILEEQESPDQSIFNYSPSTFPQNAQQYIDNGNASTEQTSESSQPLSQDILDQLNKYHREREYKKKRNIEDCQSTLSVIYGKYEDQNPDIHQQIDSYDQDVYYIDSAHILETIDIIIDLMQSAELVNEKKKKYMENIKTILFCYGSQKLLKYLNEVKQYKKLYRKFESLYK